MSDAWLGFLGGIVAALVGGLIASLVQRHNEKAKRSEEAHLTVYFMLMELSQHYFWVASAEIRREEIPEEAMNRCRDLSWRLADHLRKFDAVEYLDEILLILFSASIESSNERAKRLDKLIDHYGKLVNPSYSRAIARISRENVLLLGSAANMPKTVPGMWRFLS